MPGGIGDAVEVGNGMACGQQAVLEDASEEARSSGDQYAGHAPSSLSEKMLPRERLDSPGSSSMGCAERHAATTASVVAERGVA